jgi:MFS transporter, FSR family, fosmidomycin resistance protein
MNELRVKVFDLLAWPRLRRWRRRQAGLRLAQLGAWLRVVRCDIHHRRPDRDGILALLPLPLTAGLAVLPEIGMALNGTWSVLYGTVREMVAAARRQRAFSIFYTGGVGPVL